MKTIYKYPLEPENSIFFDLPRGAEIISVQEQYGMFSIYAVVDTDEAETERFEVLLYGTGHNIEANLSDYKFLGTVSLYDGKLVFHTFHKKCA